ncbi:MAG TPA: hypothetical protein VEJ20_09625 [Candidatus Eremiobacteraceae bacterium]|nr:hypothetical protein [Candidatus Eremiobacteraceae bacterium]
MHRNLLGSLVASLLLIGPTAASASPFPGSGDPRPVYSASTHYYGYPSIGTSTCAWHIIPSPNKNTTFSSFQNSLVAVEATSSTAAWADGYYANSSGAHSLLEEWNGTTWTAVTAPVPADGNSEALNGIGADSASDVWAAGSYFDTTANENNTLIMHYNGTTWSIIPSPNASNSNNYLKGVSVVAANDAWVAGYSTNLTSGDTSPLVEHWNGATWTIVPSYNAGEPYSAALGVSAFSATNAHVLGDTSTTANPSALRALGAHYTGTWTMHAAPPMGTGSSPLNAQTAITGSNIWALGDWYDGSNFQSLAEHWNGSSWTIVASPDNGGVEGSADNTVLLGATTVNDAEVWGVGLYFDGTLWQTFTMEYTGTWAIVPSPNVGGENKYYNQLNGAADIPGTGDVWAVGFHGTTSGSNNTVPSETLALLFHC